MDKTKDIQTTTYRNFDNNVSEFLIADSNLQPDVPLLTTTEVEIQSLVDSLEYVFSNSILENNCSNYADLSFGLVEITELPSRGVLMFNGTVIEKGMVFSLTDIGLLKFVGQSFESKQATIRLRFKPTSMPLSDWSEELSVVLSLVRQNKLPTVSDKEVGVAYRSTYIITSADVTKDYQDFEGNPFKEIIISSISGPGTLLFNNQSITVFPLKVTKSDLDSGKLVYSDTTSIKEQKEFVINFITYDEI